MPRDPFRSKISRAVGAILPKRAFGRPVYYQTLVLKAVHNQMKVDKLKLLDIKSLKDVFKNIENNMEIEYRKRIADVPQLRQQSQQKCVDLANDLAVAFYSSRHFRVGWVVDEYWKIYDQLDVLYQTQLDGLTGF
ncbi:hypothetical protein ACFX4N_23505 [Priestia sp. YIM B13551]|uniref:hypothetical protein n=1 Tax=Priestia sp. YIM B13551 TaxID=3366306 RepID=UPI00366BB0E5